MTSTISVSATKPTSTNISLAAIIPAYNEAGRICNVLEVLRGVGVIKEIIVVDDGSSDLTVEEAIGMKVNDPRIKVISHSMNQGKGQAIFTGWKSTTEKHLLFLDADLLALKPEHIMDLILPVVRGQADMTMGLFRKGYFRTDLAHWATPWLTGQRCLRADLLQDISFDAAQGYGIETALTVAAKQYQWRVVRVALTGVYHTPSENHRGLWRGIRTRARMYAQIIRAWYQASGDERFSVRKHLFKKTG